MKNHNKPQNINYLQESPGKVEIVPQKTTLEDFKDNIEQMDPKYVKLAEDFMTDAQEEYKSQSVAERSQRYANREYEKDSFRELYMFTDEEDRAKDPVLYDNVKMAWSANSTPTKTPTRKQRKAQEAMILSNMADGFMQREQYLSDLEADTVTDISGSRIKSKIAALDRAMSSTAMAVASKKGTGRW